MGRANRRQPFGIALGALLSLFSVCADHASSNPDPAIGIALAPEPLVPGHDRAFANEVLAAHAKSFVSALASKWSDSNAVTLDGLDAFYAGQVDYFGKRLSRDRVLADKRRFVERWPQRTYRIQSSNEQCSTSECLVEGYVEWEARSPARKARASGVAGFRYILVPSGHAFIITAEGGNVVQRRSAMHPGPAVAKGARYEAVGEDLIRDREPHATAEIKRVAATIADDGMRVPAGSHQRNPAVQPESTLAQEPDPDHNTWPDLFDARLVTAAVFILGFILWRAVRRHLGKSKSGTSAEARPNRRTEQRAESKKRNHKKPGHAFSCRSARSRWDRQGPAGFCVTGKAQRRDATKQDTVERRWQELRAAVRQGKTEHQRYDDREEAADWPDGIAWWSVLEVSPAAGKDEIVRSYRRKILRCHPDRVSGLAPEFVLLAERHTKTLNEAYAQAMRACN